jgi:Tfp pilus assembly protein PilN
MQSPETENKIEASTVCLLPGHLFFIESLELPQGLAEEEINAYAELILEANAPFPLEQLNWGRLQDREKGRLLLFATHKDRLKQMGYTDLARFTWVLPDFVALNGHSLAAGNYRLVTTEAVTDLHFEHSTIIPDTIVARTQASDLPTVETDHAFELLSADVSEQAAIVFQVRSEANAAPRETILDEVTLWEADIRASDFKINERRNRLLSNYLYQGFKWAAGFAALLLLAEGLLFGFNFWLKGETNQVLAQATSVAKIQEQQALTLKLEQVFSSELRPVAMLEKLNQLRPEGIHFDETSSASGNQITIEGVARSINELNDYTEKLKASGQFKLLKNPKALTRSGQTTFSVDLTYTHLEPKPQPIPEPAVKETEKAKVKTEATTGATTRNSTAAKMATI